MPAFTNINGQIFVALQNRETIKLSVIPVLLVESNTAATRLKQISWLSFSNEVALELKYVRMTRRMGSAGRQGVAVVRSMVEKRGNDIVMEDLMRQRKEALEGGGAPEMRFRNFGISEDELRRLDNGPALFERIGLDPRGASQTAFYHQAFSEPWSGVLATVITDADGKFSFRAPIDKNLVLIAYAMRKIGTKDEHYCWFVPVDSQKLDLQLNNLNLLENLLLTMNPTDQEIEERKKVQEVLEEKEAQDIAMAARKDAEMKMEKEAAEARQREANQSRKQAAIAQAKAEVEQRALKYYQQKADQGYGFAQYELGLLYLNGKGVETNREQAVQWFRAACTNEHFGASNQLRKMSIP